MLVTEILNNPTTTVDWTSQEPTFCEGYFSVGESMYYISAALHDRDEELPERWDIEFGKLDDSNRGIHTNTGTGNSFEVFSNVIAAFKQVLAKYSPKCITMGAGDSGRQSLYTKMIRKVLPTWKILQPPGGIIIAYAP